jgi:hypothetical protein
MEVPITEKYIISATISLKSDEYVIVSDQTGKMTLYMGSYVTDMVDKAEINQPKSISSFLKNSLEEPELYVVVRSASEYHFSGNTIPKPKSMIVYHGQDKSLKEICEDSWDDYWWLIILMIILVIVIVAIVACNLKITFVLKRTSQHQHLNQ